jgi:hypothetical protein
MTTIKAIITKYKGIEFRSRMEARTAVFLDALGIKWEYEKEGYELENRFFELETPESADNSKTVKYLPDFYVPRQERFRECFIEVKGKEPEYDENLKAFLLCEATKLPVYFVFDFPFIKDDGGVRQHIKTWNFQSNPLDSDSIATGVFDEEDVYDDYEFYYFKALGGNLLFCEFNNKIMLCRSEFAYTEPNDDDGHIEPCFQAYDKARNAKFEF